MERLLSMVILLALFSLVAGQANCAWDKDDDFPVDYPPLLIDQASWKIMHPRLILGDRIVSANFGDQIVVACPKKTIAVLGVEAVQGTCAGGTDIDIAGTNYNIEDLICNAKVQDEQILTGANCGPHNVGKEVHIGFKLKPPFQFVTTIKVCFRMATEVAIYAKHIIHGESIAAQDGNSGRPKFKPGRLLYQQNPCGCYDPALQKTFFGNLTGNPNYINKNCKFFSRGHLSPKADFITNMEKETSFYYSNAVPQWQPYNEQNWAYVEDSSRILALKRKYDIIVWQGPIDRQLVISGTAVFICDTVIPQRKVTPIPEQLWKVVYDPPTPGVPGKGVAIITFNGPHGMNFGRICRDQDCSKITWMHIYLKDHARGYTYCCTVQALRAALNYAPDLPANTGYLDD